MASSSPASRLSLEWYGPPMAGADPAWHRSGWTFGNLAAWKCQMGEYRHSLAKYPARLVAADGSVVWSGGAQ